MNFTDKMKGIGKLSTSSPKRKPDELKVTNGLAVTPSQMMKLARQGVPITAQNEQNFYDGDTNASWSIAPEKLRGVDPADLWTASMTARKKIRSATRKNESDN